MGEGEPFTSTSLAERLEVKEHQVRPVLGWLRAGGVVEEAERVTRRDHRGGYRARAYLWTGEERVERVARDPEQRRERQVEGLIAEGVSTPVMLRRRPLTLSKCYPQRYPRAP